jgi:hypothetical protein
MENSESSNSSDLDGNVASYSTQDLINATHSHSNNGHDGADIQIEEKDADDDTDGDDEGESAPQRKSFQERQYLKKTLAQSGVASSSSSSSCESDGCLIEDSYMAHTGQTARGRMIKFAIRSQKKKKLPAAEMRRTEDDDFNGRLVNKEDDGYTPSLTETVRDVYLEASKKLEPSIMALTFRDFTYCSMHYKFHFKLRHGNNSEEMYGKEIKMDNCGKCFMNGFEPEGPADQLLVGPCASMSLEQAQQQWRCHTSFMKHDPTGMKKRNTNTDEYDMPEDKTQTLRKERVVFVQYMRIALERRGAERRRLIFAYIKGEKQSASVVKQLECYDTQLVEFRNTLIMRIGNYASDGKQVDNSKMCVRYCSQHDAFGDLVPYRPVTLYRLCGMCLKPKNPRQVKASTFEQVSEKSLFKAITSENNEKRSNYKSYRKTAP